MTDRSPTFRWEKGDVPVVQVSPGAGSFADADIMADLQPVLSRLRESQASSLVVDFREVDYFGSSILEALRMIGNELPGDEGCLALCNLNDVGKEILEIAHFDRIFPICNSREEAVRVALERTAS